MTYKEFYFWMEGFMTNRNWTTIKQVDIDVIQKKMSEVKDVDPFFPNPRTIVPIQPIEIPRPKNPFDITFKKDD